MNGNTLRPCLAALILLVLGAEGARGHFLFVRIRPPAEAGRFAEVYFSDEGEAGDPRFIDKIAHTKLWLQTKPGAFEPLTVHKTADRLRALVPSNGGLAVIGECTYGVLARPKQTAFLLRHYPKAVAGSVGIAPERVRARFLARRGGHVNGSTTLVRRPVLAFAKEGQQQHEGHQVADHDGHEYHQEQPGEDGVGQEALHRVMRASNR